MSSLTYDHGERYVYWHDTEKRTIYRQLVNDSLIKRRTDTWETVFEKTSGLVGGMAIDWLTGNVYWTDAHLRQIRMTRKHPTATDLERVVVGEGLDKPTNIAVDPVNRRLYWGDEGSDPRIETSDLEGGDRYRLTEPSSVGKVNCLSLDLTETALYFVNEDNNLPPKVRRLDLHTRKVTEVFDLVGRTFPGIAAHGDYIYLLNSDYLEVQVWTKTGQKPYTYTIDAFPHDIVVTDKLAPHWTPPTDCDNMNCGDFCVRLGTGEAQCRCRDKYYFRLDGRNCISSEPRFIYAQDGHLWDAKADITLASHSAELSPVLLTKSRDFRSIEGLGYHFTKDLAFFSDTQSNDVYRVKVETKQFVQITANAYNVEGVTVCWLADTLYWTDSELRHIMTSHLDGRYHRILLSDVGKPRGIGCDAIHGYLFFVEADGRTIERTYTDGTNRQTIIAKIEDPQSIVVDPRAKRIYWTQGVMKQLHMANFDGQDKLAVGATNQVPYGVTLFQNFLVWTESNGHPKVALNNNGPRIKVSVTSQQANYVTKTRDIVTFDHFLQPEALGPCLANGGCQQLCFPTPDGPSCNCAIGYKLSDDGRTCTTVVAERRFVLFVDPFHKAIYQMDDSGSTRAIPIDRLDFPVSIDLDPETGKVFWIDLLNSVIRSSYTNGVDEQDIWKFGKDRKPVKLAYNNANRRLYFCDVGAGYGGLYSLSRDGGTPQVVIQGLTRPSALAIDIPRNVIYFAELGTTQAEATVSAVDMDGNNKRIIAQAEVKVPADVAILPDEGVLFWTDSFGGEVWIHNVSSGQTRRIHSDNTRKVGALSADDTLLYFSASEHKSVFSLPWRDQNPQVRKVNNPIFARIYDIKAYPNIILIPPPVTGVGIGIPGIWIGAGVAAAILLGLLLLLIICCCCRKKQKNKDSPGGGISTGFDDEVEREYIGVIPSTLLDMKGGLANGNGHTGNGYGGNAPEIEEPDYQNYHNGGVNPVGGGDAHFTSSAPQIGNDPTNLAAAAAVVMSTGQLRATRNKYEKNKPQGNGLDPNAFDMGNGKVGTMMQRLAKRLRTGISSIRWTNGEESRSRGSNPPADLENPGDPEVEQVGVQKKQYSKRPPIGPFKPQLHRLPQGFSPASRVTPSAVKNTWNRHKKRAANRDEN